MNLIKTPLRSRLTQRNLEAIMRISMEGKDKLSDSDLDTLVDKFKNKKDRSMTELAKIVGPVGPDRQNNGRSD